MTISPSAAPELPEPYGGALLDFARSFAKAAARGTAGKVPLPSTTAAALRFGFDGRAGVLAKELARCFGLGGTDSLVRKGRRNARVIIGHGGSGGAESVEHTLTLSRRPELAMALPADSAVPIDLEPDNRFGVLFELFASLSEDAPEERARDLGTSMLFSLFGLSVLPSLVGPLCSRAYYLPADRTGAMHLYKLVARTLVAEAASTSFGPATASMLTGVAADFLGQLIERAASLDAPPLHESDLGSTIEAAMLEGSVRIEQSKAIGVPRFL